MRHASVEALVTLSQLSRQLPNAGNVFEPELLPRHWLQLTTLNAGLVAECKRHLSIFDGAMLFR